ncbi:type IV pili methyl-accepting chemotaxis transducer N-terminal domain-containing protein [Aquimarina agarivorans]|uniref:type IV pili methyl-accepting chemotaxis transducer N-terminal domain-containing protein n=1 Tax=Aquimarina agarivorans TaxID=980584 RepID=UPI000248FD79|nr:type IV pili methyl-accepting chemotaxis transducer N-terminal domain-containing protein [Aquimarina agarivorans]
MKYLKFLTTLFIFATFCFCHAQNTTYGNISYEKAINTAGKQRMLSQKIAKVRMLKAINETTSALTNEFTASIKLFERNLKIIESNSREQSPKVKALIRQQNAEWVQFNDLVNKPQIDIEKLLSKSESLLSKCNSLVLAIEEDSKFNKQLNFENKASQLKVETINKAGKQRMLSQKLCLYYAACKFFKKGDKSKKACNRYVAIYNQINSVVNDLLVNELNTSEIDENIALAMGVIDGIEINKKLFLDNKMDTQKVVSITNSMLSIFNKITSQYSLL